MVGKIEVELGDWCSCQCGAEEGVYKCDRLPSRRWKIRADMTANNRQWSAFPKTNSSSKESLEMVSRRRLSDG